MDIVQCVDVVLISTVDIDECAEGRDNCTFTCSNVPGGFRCGCPSGLEVDPADPTLCNGEKLQIILL